MAGERQQSGPLCLAEGCRTCVQREELTATQPSGVTGPIKEVRALRAASTLDLFTPRVLGNITGERFSSLEEESLMICNGVLDTNRIVSHFLSVRSHTHPLANWAQSPRN